MPLGQWLADSAPPVSEARLVGPSDHPMSQPPEVEAERLFKLRLEAELARARLESDHVAEEQVAAARAEERRERDFREAAAEAAWRARIAELTDGALRLWKEELLHALGQSLSKVLRPFLSDQAERQARVQLLALLSEALKSTGDSFLELRAPLPLHDDLRQVMQRNGVRAVLSESRQIEFVTRTGTSLMEDLSAEWINCVMANAT